MIKQILIQGFRSFDKEQVFNFDNFSGLNLITGVNKVDERLGANGVGKSSLFEALTWALFGKTSTNLKAGDIKNWTSNTPCKVTVIFTDGSILVRTWSPNGLTLNSKTVTQDEVDNYTKLNFQSFIYSVFISQFGAKFVDLSPSEKMDLFSSLIDDLLGKWINYSDNAKVKKDEYESKILIIEKEVANLEGQISVLTGNNLEIQLDEWNINLEKKKNDVFAKLVAIQDELAKLDTTKDKCILAKLEKRKGLLEQDIEVKKGELSNLRVDSDPTKMYNELMEAKVNLSFKENLRLLNKVDRHYTEKDIEDLENDLDGIDMELTIFKTDKEQIEKHLKAIEDEIFTINIHLPLKEKELTKYEDLRKQGKCPTCGSNTESTDIYIAITVCEANIKTFTEALVSLKKKEQHFLAELTEVNTNIAAYDSKATAVIEEIKNGLLSTEQEKTNEVLQVEIEKVTLVVSNLTTQHNLLQEQEKLFYDDLNALQTEYKTVFSIYNSLEKEINEIEYKIQSLFDTMTKLNEIQLELQNEINPFIALIDSNKKQLTKLQKNVIISKEKILTYNKYIEVYKYWMKGFKDIRLMLLSEALLGLEISINNSIQKLGLINWEVKLDVDSENKSGKIRKGFSVLIKSPINEKIVPFEAFSGGEGQRIRLALTLGLSEFIKQQRGLDYYFIVLDEPTQHLSEEGILDLLTCLKEESENTTIFFIDHKDLISSGVFSKIIKIEKTDEGSKLLV